MQTIKGFRIRLYPTQEQIPVLIKYCHAFRFVYNWAVTKHDEVYKDSKVFLTEYKLKSLFSEYYNDTSNPDHEWLSGLKTHTLSNAITVFMKNLNAHMRDKMHVGKPRFKCKHSSKMYFFTRKDSLHIYRDRIIFEGFNSRFDNKKSYIYTGKHHIPCDKNYNYCEPRIELDKDNRWWFSCSIKWDKPKWISPNCIVRERAQGLDLGIKHFVTDSDGDTYDYPNDKLKKLEKRRKRQDRRVAAGLESRRAIAQKAKTKLKNIPKSKNQLKREAARRKTERKMANIRRNTQYDIANKIINKNPRAICMEGINVTALSKNKHVAKYIQDNSFYRMKEIIKKKCEDYDIHFVEADRFFPSSKMCSNCGYKKQSLKLSDRVYKCDRCGLVIDRDVNAAINLRNLTNVTI